MDIPAEVLIHNDLLGMKGGRGRLLSVSPHGYYEVNLHFGEKVHRTLLPVDGTVLIATESEVNPDLAHDVER